uniref:Uncharacterized protein n=1 Tax=Oryza meridionalis TaxID=40149 RepID=A0A0E0C4Q2_9ORYZ
MACLGAPCRWGTHSASVVVDESPRFLICYFHYMPTRERLFYLRATKGDLLTAVHLIEADRCTRGFDAGQGTTQTALRCAAGAVGHADMDGLARPCSRSHCGRGRSLAFFS